MNGNAKAPAARTIETDLRGAKYKRLVFIQQTGLEILLSEKN